MFKHKQKMFTINEIKNQYTDEKRRQDKSTNFWVYLFNRNISFYPTWIFLRLGMSANQVTFFSIIIGLVGCLYFSIGGKNNFIIGAILINVWAILDCVDGNMARLLNSTSSYGWFLDSITGLLLNAVLLFSIGIGSFLYHDEFIFMLSSILKVDNLQIISLALLIVGCFGSLAALFYALIIHLFNSIYKRDLFGSETERENSSNLIAKLIYIGRYLTGFGFVEPIILFASIFNYASIIIIIFSPINIAAAVYVSLKAISTAKDISIGNR